MKAEDTGCPFCGIEWGEPEPWDREEAIFEDGKKAGIKEVVDWVNKHISDGRGVKKWRDKEKEWGVEL